MKYFSCAIIFAYIFSLSYSVQAESLEEITILSDNPKVELNAASLKKEAGTVRVEDRVQAVEEVEAIVDMEIQKVDAEQNTQAEITPLGESTQTQKIVKSSITQVAWNATETPATWAETWVLIVMSLFVNTLYCITRKKTSSRILV